MGVFQIVVDPLFRPLLGPTGPPTSFAGYTGFHSSDGHLTSPVLIDFTTSIGRSAPHPRPTPFPQTLGFSSWDTITNGYSDYPVIPLLWSAAAPSTDEVLTEIKSFVLSTYSSTSGQEGCTNPMVPLPPGNYAMVTAGTGAGVSPRSLGIVQEDGPPGPPDFPARSFFDIFVEVNLPWLPGTESSVAFPMTGAVLTNVQPLVVTNLDLASFPPQVLYIHGGNTNAVQLRFKFNHPPYWAAGDLFGTLVLAGHGTFPPDCSQEDALVGAVLGTTNAPVPGMPTEWLRTSTLFPSTGSAYNSLMTDTNPPSGSDTLAFGSVAGGAIYLNNLSLFNFPSPITPPPLNSSASYTDSVVEATFQVSPDQINWSSATASGFVIMKMSNASAAGDTTSTFITQIQSLYLTNGTFILRQDLGNSSVGGHTIRSDPRGYRISSFFDVFTDLSLDGGGTWMPANRSIRLEASAPPAAPGSLFINPVAGGGGVNLQWMGPFTLQSSLVATGAYTDVSGSTGGSLANSWPITTGPKQMYFRLRQ
jgi:hypothetical protein